jgi:hypothetical protein
MPVESLPGHVSEGSNPLSGLKLEVNKGSADGDSLRGVKIL